MKQHDLEHGQRLDLVSRPSLAEQELFGLAIIHRQSYDGLRGLPVIRFVVRMANVEHLALPFANTRRSDRFQFGLSEHFANVAEHAVDDQAFPFDPLAYVDDRPGQVSQGPVEIGAAGLLNPRFDLAEHHPGAGDADEILEERGTVADVPAQGQAGLIAAAGLVETPRGKFITAAGRQQQAKLTKALQLRNQHLIALLAQPGSELPVAKASAGGSVHLFELMGILQPIEIARQVIEWLLCCIEHLVHHLVIAEWVPPFRRKDAVVHLGRVAGRQIACSGKSRYFKAGTGTAAGCSLIARAGFSWACVRSVVNGVRARMNASRAVA